jgi:hypothetical protein
MEVEKMLSKLKISLMVVSVMACLVAKQKLKQNGGGENAE